MADQATKNRILRQTRKGQVVPPEKGRAPSKITTATVVEKPSNKAGELTPTQMLVAQWYARGLGGARIARKLQFHLVPHESDEEQRLKKARRKVRDWLSTKKMRDAVYA